MNLIPWRSKSRQMEAPRGGERDFDNMLERFFDAPWGDPWSAEALAAPLDVSETEDELIVRAELPGIDPKELEITLTGDVLTFSGEKKEEQESEQGGAIRRERRFGAFRRSVQLPGFVDTRAVEAEHKHGVVTVHLKKSEEARPRRIEVRAGRGPGSRNG